MWRVFRWNSDLLDKPLDLKNGQRQSFYNFVYSKNGIVVELDRQSPARIFMVVRVHPMPQRYAFIKVCYILFRLFFHLKIHKIFLALRSNWHRGRVARQSSAKACTAVRIRSMPQNPVRCAGFFVFIAFLFSRFLPGYQTYLLEENPW